MGVTSPPVSNRLAMNQEAIAAARDALAGKKFPCRRGHKESNPLGEQQTLEVQWQPEHDRVFIWVYQLGAHASLFGSFSFRVCLEGKPIATLTFQECADQQGWFFAPPDDQQYVVELLQKT